jgi:hypothetical protein
MVKHFLHIDNFFIIDCMEVFALINCQVPVVLLLQLTVLLFSVYIIMSFDLPFVRLFSNFVITLISLQNLKTGLKWKLYGY